MSINKPLSASPCLPTRHTPRERFTLPPTGGVPIRLKGTESPCAALKAPQAVRRRHDMGETGIIQTRRLTIHLGARRKRICSLAECHAGRMDSLPGDDVVSRIGLVVRRSIPQQPQPHRLSTDGFAEPSAVEGDYPASTMQRACHSEALPPLNSRTPGCEAHRPGRVGSAGQGHGTAKARVKFIRTDGRHSRLMCRRRDRTIA